MSSKLQIVNFHPAHFMMMENKRDFFSSDEEIMDRLTVMYQREKTRIKTIFCEGRVIGILGACILFGSTAEVWTFLSNDVSKVSLSFHKAVLQELEWVEKTFGVERMQMTVDEHNEPAKKWATSLGFKCEGLMMKYAFGRNNYLFARVN